MAIFPSYNPKVCVNYYKFGFVGVFEKPSPVGAAFRTNVKQLDKLQFTQNDGCYATVTKTYFIYAANPVFSM